MRLSAISLLIVLAGLVVGRADQPQRPAVIDMALMKSGQLISRCQDEAGHPVAGATVTLSQAGTQIAGTTSGPDGWFMFHGVPPGLYHMRSGTWQNTVRIWAPQTAPPAAAPRIALILESPAATSVIEVAASSESTTPTAVPSTSQKPGTIQLADESAAETLPEVVSPELPIEIAAEPSSPTADVSKKPTAATPLPSRRVEVLAAATGAAAQPSNTSDAVFRPFLETMSAPAGAPLPVEPDAAAPQQMPTQPPDAQLPNSQPNNFAPPGSAAPGDDTMGPPEIVYQPVAYQSGPTVGDVVLASAAFGGIAVGAVALYKYDHRKDHVRTIVSP